MAGQFNAAESLIKQEERSGDAEAAAEMVKRQSKFGPPSARIQKMVMESGRLSGTEFVGEIEKRQRQVLTNALAAESTDAKFTAKEVAKQMKAVVLSYLERADGKPIRFSMGDVPRETFAKKPKKTRKGPAGKITSAAEWRRRQARAKWKKEAREVADWKAGKRKIPPSYLKAKQAATRFRTGWNRWRNASVQERSVQDPAVVYYQFTLGRAKNHTEVCLARDGWVLAKNDPRLAENTPPLHWDCRSKLMPITRSAAKAEKIKRWTPKKYKKFPPDEGFGGRTKTRKAA